MAISPQNRARALELAKELNEINGGRYHDDGTPKTFDEREIETNALTNLLSSMALNVSAKDLPTVGKPRDRGKPRENLGTEHFTGG